MNIVCIFFVQLCATSEQYHSVDISLPESEG